MVTIKTAPSLFQGETIFPTPKRGRIHTKTKVADGGSKFIQRMYARAGNVVVIWDDYKTNKEEEIYMQPDEALTRIASLEEMNQKNWMPDGLKGAVVKAAMAAKGQTVEGFGLIEDAGEWDAEELAHQMEQGLLEARQEDPELHREMCAIERANGEPEFILPAKSTKSRQEQEQETVRPDQLIDLKEPQA